MTIDQADHIADNRRRQSLMAAGGLLGALAASSCCILPLVLFGRGVSGAWIGNFTRLAPYQPYFIAATLGFLGTAIGWFTDPQRAPVPMARRAHAPCRTASSRQASSSQRSSSSPRSASISSHLSSSTRDWRTRHEEASCPRRFCRRHHRFASSDGRGQNNYLGREQHGLRSVPSIVKGSL